MSYLCPFPINSNNQTLFLIQGYHHDKVDGNLTNGEILIKGIETLLLNLYFLT